MALDRNIHNLDYYNQNIKSDIVFTIKGVGEGGGQRGREPPPPFFLKWGGGHKWVLAPPPPHTHFWTDQVF